MRAFTEHMGASCKDADLDGDPKTTEYSREEEMVTLYDDGVPEMIGMKQWRNYLKVRVRKTTCTLEV